MKFPKKLIVCGIAVLFLSQLSAQDSIVLDKIAATVAGAYIKQSEIQNQYYQMRAEGLQVDDATKCTILEEMLVQKLLVDQAKFDSLKVTPQQVDGEIARRLKELSSQIGSMEKLEKFYGKTELEIKTEWRPLIEEQLLAQQAQGKVVQSIEVTPNDIQKFFKSLPPDSLPQLNAQYEVAQIVTRPPITKEQRDALKIRLEEIRQRIITGESFAKLAALYSDDKESAKRGGELGYVSRADLVPDFAAVAFKIKMGEVSRIVETEYGLHIIEALDKKGDKLNCRHILLMTKSTGDDMLKAKTRLDSICDLIVKDSIKFEKAAGRYSEDDDTRNNGGLYVNPFTNSSKFDIKQLDPSMYNAIKDLTPGLMSKPFLTQDKTGKSVYKVVKLISRTEAHRASIKEDYQLIKELALRSRKQAKLMQWIESKRNETFIKIDKEYSNCSFKYKGWEK